MTHTQRTMSHILRPGLAFAALAAGAALPLVPAATAGGTERCGVTQEALGGGPPGAPAVAPGGAAGPRVDPAAAEPAAAKTAPGSRSGARQRRLMGLGTTGSTLHDVGFLAIDAVTGAATVVAALPPGGFNVRERPRDLEFSADGDLLYVATSIAFTPGGMLHTLDATTFEHLGAHWIQSDDLDSIEREATGTLLAVTRHGHLLRIDPSSGSVAAVGMFPTFVRSIARAPDGRFFALTWSSWPFFVAPAILEFDPLDGTTLSWVPIARPARPTALEITRDGRFLVSGASGALFELDPATGAGTLLGPLGLPHAVHGLASRP